METLTRFRLTTNMKFIRQRSTPLTNPPHRYYIQKYISITLRHNVEISSDGDLIIFFFRLIVRCGFTNYGRSINKEQKSQENIKHKPH